MRINISMADKLLAELDGYCYKNKVSRSGFISELVTREVVTAPVVTKEMIEKVAGTMDTSSLGTVSNTATGMNLHSGFCDIHFEKGVKYPLKLITWEDENGTAVIDKKYACPKCVNKYQNMGRGRVYFL